MLNFFYNEKNSRNRVTSIMPIMFDNKIILYYNISILY